ncbi:MAG TPA: hypothetical protein VGO69_06925 [Pyrinomonadaceae bacterium]|nr:hypothetical protein [Pyrinomonadaceae bacterium]
MLSVFAYGRGNYSYISRDREWQQTTSFFGKAALAYTLLMEAMTRESVTEFPVVIVRPDLKRFEFFRRGERQAGVWVVRQGPLYFTLPITTGTKPGVADYLPAPHGLAGIAAPVEQVYPSLTPFIELSDGRVLVAGDGADEIEAAPDGSSLRAVWRRWVVAGGRSGQLVDPHITSEVIWHVNGTTLTREETLLSSEAITLRRWWVALPMTAARSEVDYEQGQRLYSFKGDGVIVKIAVTADWPLNVSLAATGNSALGRGARGPVPLHLIYESNDLRLAPSNRARWRITINVEGKK